MELADGSAAHVTLHTIDGTIPQLRRGLDRSLDACGPIRTMYAYPGQIEMARAVDERVLDMGHQMHTNLYKLWREMYAVPHPLSRAKMGAATSSGRPIASGARRQEGYPAMIRCRKDGTGCPPGGLWATTGQRPLSAACLCVPARRQIGTGRLDAAKRRILPSLRPPGDGDLSRRDSHLPCRPPSRRGSCNCQTKMISMDVGCMASPRASREETGGLPKPAPHCPLADPTR